MPLFLPFTRGDGKLVLVNMNLVITISDRCTFNPRKVCVGSTLDCGQDFFIEVTENSEEVLQKIAYATRR
jgi:hypothetical protein